MPSSPSTRQLVLQQCHSSASTTFPLHLRCTHEVHIHQPSSRHLEALGRTRPLPPDSDLHYLLQSEERPQPRQSLPRLVLATGLSQSVMKWVVSHPESDCTLKKLSIKLSNPIALKSSSPRCLPSSVMMLTRVSNGSEDKHAPLNLPSWMNAPTMQILKTVVPVNGVGHVDIGGLTLAITEPFLVVLFQIDIVQLDAAKPMASAGKVDNTGCRPALLRTLDQQRFE